MSYESTNIKLTDVEDSRTWREVKLHDGGLVVDASDKSHLGIEVLFRNAVAGIDIEPVVCVGKATTERSIVALQPGAPGFGVVTAQIEIAEQHEFRVHPARAIVRIQWVAGLFIRGHEANV